MRTRQFKDVFDEVVSLFGRDPQANISADMTRGLVRRINQRARVICQVWRWPQWELTEERALSEARAAVENNRIALEHSKAYLESILANLTAGVFVFDRQFRLTTANRGAERIFRQPFQAVMGSALDQIGARLQAEDRVVQFDVSAAGLVVEIEDLGFHVQPSAFAATWVASRFFTEPGIGESLCGRLTASRTMTQPPL